MKHTHYRIPFPGRSMRIMQISDVHLSPLVPNGVRRMWLRDLETAAASFHPHAIAVTGDLISRSPRPQDLEDGVKMAASLGNYARVLYIFGNHEADMPKDLRRVLHGRMTRAGVLMLNNKTAILRGNRISGLVMPSRFYKSADGDYSSLPTMTEAEITSRLGISSPGTILLAHNPLWLHAYAAWGASLVLSGHVHGGVVRLPGIGGVLSPERRFFPQYSKGIYRSGASVMAVSAGIGKLRILNPPEVLLLELEGKR